MNESARSAVRGAVLGVRVWMRGRCGRRWRFGHCSPGPDPVVWYARMAHGEGAGQGGSQSNAIGGQGGRSLSRRREAPFFFFLRVWGRAEFGPHCDAAVQPGTIQNQSIAIADASPMRRSHVGRVDRRGGREFAVPPVCKEPRQAREEARVSETRPRPRPTRDERETGRRRVHSSGWGSTNTHRRRSSASPTLLMLLFVQKLLLCWFCWVIESDTQTRARLVQQPSELEPRPTSMMM